MTATEFEIEHPEDPETATLRANTDRIDKILPQLENIRKQTKEMATMQPEPSNPRDGILTQFRQWLSSRTDTSSNSADKKAAEELTAEYASQLQQRLESEGKWDKIRTIAMEDS